jgi:high-affinity nickel-transport protein
MGGVVALAHLVGFAVLLSFVAAHRVRIGGAGALTLGIGLTAYTLGLRHAFDADHIAAIDNTTRKLMAEGKRPLSVGFWFSLGHSTIVFALALLLAVGIRSLAGPVRSSNSSLHAVTNYIGTGVSGAFLYVIAALNIVVLVGIFKIFRAIRRGRYDEAALEAQLAKRGMLNRLLAVRTRLRYRDRGSAAGTCRRCGRGWAALVRDPVPAGSVCRRDEPDGFD